MKISTSLIGNIIQMWMNVRQPMEGVSTSAVMLREVFSVSVERATDSVQTAPRASVSTVWRVHIFLHQ